MKPKLRFLVKNKQSFIALFILLVMVFNACSNPSGGKPEASNTGNFSPMAFYVDSDGNLTETDSGRTVFVADDKAEVVSYSDNIESGDDDDHVGLIFDNKAIIFFFEKDRNFPNRIVLSNSEKSYNGILTPYDTETQTYGLTLVYGDEKGTLSNIALSKDIFTQYKDDTELTPSQNLRMRNLYIATCIYKSLDDFIASGGTLRAASGGIPRAAGDDINEWLQGEKVHEWVFEYVQLPDPYPAIIAYIGALALDAVTSFIPIPISLILGSFSENPDIFGVATDSIDIFLTKEASKKLAWVTFAIGAIRPTVTLLVDLGIITNNTEGIILNEHSIIFPVGSKASLTATVKPDGVRTRSITWSNSDPQVATVSSGTDTWVKSSSSTVTGVKVGVAVITVTTDNNIKDYCIVTVTPNTVNPIADDFTIRGTGTFTYNGSPRSVTITPKPGKSTGAITVKYNGNTAAPSAVGTYTVTFDVAVAAGFNAVSGLSAGTLTINPKGGSSPSPSPTPTKGNGAVVSTPTLNTRTLNSITINAVSAPSTGQSVEYAINTINTAPLAGWQATTTFSGLNAGTTYYIFARSVSNNSYNTGAASGSLTIATLQTVLSDGIEYYWVDQHDNLVTTSGGAAAITVGSTLVITAQDTGYVVKNWYLNGVKTEETGNTYNFSSATTGKHTVSVVVEKSGKPYNTNITITVQ